jgi:hypothetical protein
LATRRVRLAIAARSDRAVFRRTHGLAVQVMERRELLGLTQTELDEKTGVDQGDISRIQGGLILQARCFFASPTPRRYVAGGRQRDNLNPALRPVSTNEASCQ